MYADLHCFSVCNDASTVDALAAMLLWQTGFESYVCGGVYVVSFIILEQRCFCFPGRCEFVSLLVDAVVTCASYSCCNTSFISG